MKDYTRTPESQSRTLDSNPKASRQAPVSDILQAYKNRTLGAQPVQRVSADEEELLQGKFEPAPVSGQEPLQREEKPNNTGLPDNLKAGVENLSGYSMNDVKVHYNSDKPAQLQASAYTQGTDIHVASGQEKHLPHEAWHVVQQKQGRVQPTVQLQGVNVNDNEGLEREADVMGKILLKGNDKCSENKKTLQSFNPIIQRIKIKLKDEDPILMSRLRNVRIDEQGEGRLESPENIHSVKLIGKEENIIFEGHGYVNDPLWGKAKTIGQGGFTPQELATFAHKIPKPVDWAGNIILAGCSTGEITEDVSKHYFSLAEKSVNVIGTKFNIRIGTKENGENFIGSDWGHFPDEQPTDLKYIEEILGATKTFWSSICEFTALTRQLIDFKEKKRQDIDLNITPVESICNKIVSVDTQSTETKIPQKNYMFTQREILHNFFCTCIEKLKAIDFFVYPDKVKEIVDLHKENTQLDNLIADILTLSQQKLLYSEICFYLHGLQLKEIDIFDPEQTKHSKLRRTKKGFFSDTWETDV